MYFAGFHRPRSGTSQRQHLTLPEKGWGELLLVGSTEQTGQAWSDTGAVREDRPLKHRSAKSTRTVPACPSWSHSSGATWRSLGPAREVVCS